MRMSAPTGGLEAVLFDYGGTLVTFDYPTQDLLAVLRRFRPRIEAALGAPAPEAERILHDVLVPLEEYVASQNEDEVEYMDVYRDRWHRAGLRLPDALLHDILDAEQMAWDDAVRIDPDVPEVMASLKARGMKRGICSNAPFPPAMMRRQVEGNGIAKQVDAVVFSSEVGRRKPAPEAYTAALDSIGATARRTLFVGDRVREDYEGPASIGMRAVILTAHSSRPVPPGVPTVPSLIAVLGLL
jgi:putative hydrolase of the HAD superfamily